MTSKSFYLKIWFQSLYLILHGQSDSFIIIFFWSKRQTNYCLCRRLDCHAFHDFHKLRISAALKVTKMHGKCTEKVINSNKSCDLYALATREAEFRIPGKSALFSLFLGKFLPKIHLQNPKKRFLFPHFFWKLCRMSGKYSEAIWTSAKTLPKDCRKGKKGKKQSKSLPNSNFSLGFCWQKSAENLPIKRQKSAKILPNYREIGIRLHV